MSLYAARGRQVAIITGKAALPVKCDGLDAIVTMHVPKETWSDVVNDMKSRGAEHLIPDCESRSLGPKLDDNTGHVRALCRQNHRFLQPESGHAIWA